MGSIEYGLLRLAARCELGAEQLRICWEQAYFFLAWPAAGCSKFPAAGGGFGGAMATAVQYWRSWREREWSGGGKEISLSSWWDAQLNFGGDPCLGEAAM